MADVVFNIAKGRAAYYSLLPATNDAIIVVLLKSSGLVSDATMIDYTSLSAILAGASDECDFTNYVRKTAASVTSVPDNTNNWSAADFADITWTAAGGGTNNTIGKIIVCYDPDTTGGTDADIIPLTAQDFSDTTNGSDLIAQVATAGFFKAA